MSRILHVDLFRKASDVVESIHFHSLVMEDIDETALNKALREQRVRGKMEYALEESEKAMRKR